MHRINLHIVSITIFIIVAWEHWNIFLSILTVNPPTELTKDAMKKFVHPEDKTIASGFMDVPWL